MLDQGTRTAILELHKKGHSARAISNAMNVSRDTVGKVIKSGSAEVPFLEREELADAWHDEIVAQHAAPDMPFPTCKRRAVAVL